MGSCKKSHMGVPDLTIQFITQIKTGHRAYVSICGQWIADHHLTGGFDELAGELPGNA